MTNRQKKVACVGLILFIIWNKTNFIFDGNFYVDLVLIKLAITIFIVLLKKAESFNSSFLGKQKVSFHFKLKLNSLKTCSGLILL